MITIQENTLGSEIIAAINRNKDLRAKTFNVNKAKKYLKYTETTGDIILIDYAKRLLTEELSK